MDKDCVFQIMEVLQEIVMNEFKVVDCFQTETFPQDVMSLVVSYAGKEMFPIAREIEVTTSPHLASPGTIFCQLENSWLDTSLDGKFLDCLAINLARLLERRYGLLEVIQEDQVLFRVYGWVLIDRYRRQASFLGKNLPHILQSKNWRYKLHISTENYYLGYILNDYWTFPAEILNVLRENINTNEFHQFIASRLTDKFFSDEVEKTVIDICEEVLDYSPFDFGEMNGSISYTKENRVGKFRKKKKFSRLKKQRRAKIREKKVKQRKRKAGRVHRKTCVSY